MSKLIISNGHAFPVGCLEYTLSYDKTKDLAMADCNWYGVCNKRSLVIQIKTDLAEQRKYETLCHELVHAMNNEYCGSTLDEEQVSGIGQGVAQLLKHLGIELELREN